MRVPFRIIDICICYYSPVCFPASLGGALFTPEAKEERTPSKPLNPNTKAEAGPFSEEGQFLFSPPLLTANSKKQIFNQNRQPPPLSAVGWRESVRLYSLFILLLLRLSHFCSKTILF